MKILLINTNYGGGAAIACRRQHKALLANGYDSSLLVLDKVGYPGEKNVYSIEELVSKKYGVWFFTILKFLNKVNNSFPLFFNKKAYINGPASLFRIDTLDIYRDADIVHFHWVPKIVSYKHVFADKTKTFFWTLHDMNPFTGGNHYTKDFDYSIYDKLLKKNIANKKKYLKGANLTIITPSVWLGDLAENSEVFKGFSVNVIPNCLDLNIFSPKDKIQARKKSNVGESDKKYILFVAEDPNDKRKGMHLLLSALDKIKNKSRICVLIMGKKMENVTFDFPFIQLGFKNKEVDIADCYNAADFFVIPSIEDNLPNTVLESLACGTPVLGFNIGGIPDMVINNESGLLCDINDEQGFIRNIELFVDIDDYTSFSTEARRTVESKFSEEIVIKQLSALYTSKFKKNN